MASRLKRTLLSPIRHLFPERVGAFLTRLSSKKLKDEICGEVTDKFLELLLAGMDLAFCLCKGYRKNIDRFEGRYIFGTADAVVTVSAVFRNGDMAVHRGAVPDWDVRVTFKDAAALRGYIFSRDQDILNSILANEVEVDGNLNYIFKFGFMVRDLARRFGVL